MKKVLLLVALFLGTTVMVNAQTEPAKATPAKEIKAKKVRKVKSEKKEAAPMTAVAPAKAKK